MIEEKWKYGKRRITFLEGQIEMMKRKQERQASSVLSGQMIYSLFADHCNGSLSTHQEKISGAADRAHLEKPQE